MHRRFLPVLASLALAACHVRPESFLPAGAVSHAPERSEFLLAEPASFVVLGGAESFVWPVLLQDLLDGHAGRKKPYHVLNGAAREPGIGAWTNTANSASASADGPFRTLVDDYLATGARRLGGAPPPRTALCLVSLRGLCDESGPVKSDSDMLGAEMGAEALERLALELREAGVERVVFATPLYAEGAGPELGLEHLAIERLLARGHDFVQAGPDVFRASKRYYPDAFEADGVSPNEFGLKLIAEEWYRWLAGPEAHENVVEALYSKDFDTDAIEAAFAESRGLPRP
jgi:hypothetical protein